MPEMKQLKELNAAGPAVMDFFIQWHLTENCNLRCRHCYQTDGNGNAELDTSEIKSAILEIAEMLESWAENYEMNFSPSFNLTGGEPFFRRDLFEIIEEVRNCGFEVNLLTNGTLVHPEKARQLAKLGVKGVQVSIEGPEKVHESIRGRGSFTQALWGVRNMVNAGLTVTLNMTLSNLNADNIDEMTALARNVGAKRLGFSRLVPAGRGRSLSGEMLKPEKVKELYQRLRSLNVKGLDLVSGDPIYGRDRKGGNALNDSGCLVFGGCAAGLSGLTILPDGTITPCRRLPIPIGNIRTDPVRELWATSNVLEALRDRERYKGKCGACAMWASCRGCRAIAYAYSGEKGKADYLADDPQCFHKF